MNWYYFAWTHKIITDEELANIFYILVHDFETQIAFEAASEVRHKEDNYVKCIVIIHEWAKEKEFMVIREKSKELLNKIYSLTADNIKHNERKMNLVEEYGKYSAEFRG